MSLRIIKGLPLDEYPGARIGIMAHANATSNFQEALRQYPCEDFTFCDAVGGPCQFQNNVTQCPARQRILSRTIKMCDSGIFTREGATLTYEELFAAYERMDVEYGVMIDVFRDANATITSAQEAIRAYEPYKDKFKLVVVAQGETVDDYLCCYESLRQMGFENIAVGGLLQKVPGTARFAQVRDEAFMHEVLETIRERYPDDWLFALGCYHPNRHREFEMLNVWGDYKGWIFQYEKRNDTLNEILPTLATNHLAHLDLREIQDVVHSIQQETRKRARLVEKHKTLIKTLNAGKKELKEKLRAIYDELLINQLALARRFDKVTTHGLPKPVEEHIVREALEALGKEDSEKAMAFWLNLQSNRSIRQKIKKLEAALDKKNKVIARLVTQLLRNEDELPVDLNKLANHLVNIVRSSEQAHRLKQVRQMIANDILNETVSP